MNFLREHSHEEPEVNLIPMIDVLLVIVIFLAVTTSYSKYSELKINLPQANAGQQLERSNQLTVGVDKDGHYIVNGSPVKFTDVEDLSLALRRAAGERKDPVIVIHADALTTHQAVINVMQAANVAGYEHITFTTETSRK
jgi:biopolymer transport protein ExbD